MTDYAHRDPRSIHAMLDTPARRLQLRRAAAIEWLGNRWRGRADCTHRYTRASGEQTVPGLAFQLMDDMENTTA